jgi:arylsulfatase A-like enzyme
MVAELRTRGFLDHGYVVITADHGEEFMDHQQLGHGHSMFEELLHVPLLVLGPDVKPSRVSRLVELIDLYPTVLHWAGIGLESVEGAAAGTPRGLHGVALNDLLAGAADASEPDGRAEAFAERVSEEPLAMVRVGDEKLVEVVHDGQVRHFLFDLASDPLEAHDLAAQQPARVAELLKELERRRRFARAGKIGEGVDASVGRETLQTLKRLGYVSGD